MFAEISTRVPRLTLAPCQLACVSVLLAPPTWVLLALALCAATFTGCTRQKYRLQADHEAYDAITERNVDPRWQVDRYCIDLDPRSRYFDPYDPDHSPMPLDDPASQQYMQWVNGIRGWEHWHRNGERFELENPAWREVLAGYVETGEDGSVQLDVDSALRLAYIHSPSHQRQLETLYLSALDVTAERFRLDTQFFGGYDARYVHNGSLIPAQLSFSPLLNRFVITPPIDGAGVENNRLTLGRPFGADPALQARRRFATAGELLVGFANSFVFEFTGGDANLSTSLANFTFIQPLLRGAGKDIALEQLTFEERKLLANLRAYAQFRQGFYTQVAIGELGVIGPRRGGSSTSLQSFSGQGGISGYLGLLQQLQQIRNSEDNLSLQLRTLARLEALYDNDLIDLVQVDQFRQSIEDQRDQLLDRTNSFKLALDNYKTDTLGLPSSLPVELEQSLISQFQLTPREATPILESLLELQQRLGSMPSDPEVDALNQLLSECFSYVDPVVQLLDNSRRELARMDAAAPVREQTMTEQEVERFHRDRERLYERLQDLEKGELGFDVTVAQLTAVRDGLTEETRARTLRGVIEWVRAFLLVVERLSLIPAQARLEMITVESVELRPEDAFQVALANRLDFMNGRAALVDRWRLLQVNADALQSVLNVTASGDVRTARNNPISFRAPTGSLRMGLEFDAPFTRLLERNDYRESLIEYQRGRRDFIQSRDSLEKGLRALLRTLEQRRQQLEIQRRAVTIALRRVDQTQLSLVTPSGQRQPGARSPINPTTAINLLGAQSALQNTQNNFLAAWIRYYAARLRLYRELGIMALDPEGRWIEYPIGAGVSAGGDERSTEELPLPPAVSAEWVEVANLPPAYGRFPAVPLPTAPVQPAQLRRLPATTPTIIAR